MSSLTPASFTDDERAAIQGRVDSGAGDIATLTASLASALAFVQQFVDMDLANERVQNQAISDIVGILHGIVQARDISDPANSPHFIKFKAAFPSIGGLELAGGDPFPPIPGYDDPEDSKTVVNGDGWELWHTPPPTGPAVIDPVQPSVGELTPTYPVLVSEFVDFQDYRLHGLIGTYVLKGRFAASAAFDQQKLDIITARNAFYESIGFQAGG